MRHLLFALTLTLGCAPPTDAVAEQSPLEVRQALATTRTLSPERCLRAASLRLRELPPSAQDLADLSAKRRTFSELVDGYLQGPEFAAVALRWYRSEFSSSQKPIAGVDADEPARIAQHVVVNHRDYRELLTATYTVDATGNRVALGPEAAGVLTTPQYLTARVGILRRRWAANVIRQFLGIRLVAVNLPPDTNPDVSRKAVAANPACAGCHVNKFYGIDRVSAAADCFPPELEGQRQQGCVETPSEVVGKPTNGLPSLGRAIADSHEFLATTTNFFYAKLYGRPLSPNEKEFYRAVATRFSAEQQYDAVALIRTLVNRKEFCER
ncbi:MAG: hypothetical protein K1X89_20055 [Myxococcaceae bacterium]|nr:hypothetical protein [Myxococcaceae bacterium]